MDRNTQVGKNIAALCHHKLGRMNANSAVDFLAMCNIRVRFLIQGGSGESSGTEEKIMAYVYNEVRALKGKAKVDGGECVALVRHFTRAPQTALWRKGAAVIGNKTMAAGTAIATFVNGKYPNRPKGNHSAFYLGQVSNGMYIMDQWPADTKKDISPRFIYRKGFRKDGTAFDPSDNADAFSVIE